MFDYYNDYYGGSEWGSLDSGQIHRAPEFIFKITIKKHPFWNILE